jgi:phosphatidylethanolamine/phosphatidyl-N-methylethanolamine N-methyltransferase
MASPESNDRSARPALFWERNAHRYERATLAINRRFPEMVKLVTQDVQGAARVLEVAAGTGLVTIELARVVRTLIATDRSPEMLDRLQSRVRQQSISNVTVQLADALDLEFPPNTFDAVVAANLLHLLPDPARALSEFRRVARPGGLICVPTFGHGATLLAQLTSRVLALGGFPVVTRFRAATLRALLEAEGFGVVRSTVVPGILPILYVSARAVG